MPSVAIQHNSRPTFAILKKVFENLKDVHNKNNKTELSECKNLSADRVARNNAKSETAEYSELPVKHLDKEQKNSCPMDQERNQQRSGSEENEALVQSSNPSISARKASNGIPLCIPSSVDGAHVMQSGFGSKQTQLPSYQNVPLPMSKVSSSIGIAPSAGVVSASAIACVCTASIPEF